MNIERIPFIELLVLSFEISILIGFVFIISVTDSLNFFQEWFVIIPTLVIILFRLHEYGENRIRNFEEFKHSKNETTKPKLSRRKKNE